jgi:uncharacterized membrane protein
VTESILNLWVLAASGIQLGTLWIMKLSILPLLNGLPYNRYVDTCQRIDMHLFHPIAVWNGVLASIVGVFLAVLAPSPWIAALYVAGSLGMVVVGVTSEGVNRPIWRQIEKWNPQRTAEKWAEKRYTWHVAHQVRTYAAIGAVAAYAAAFVATWPTN